MATITGFTAARMLVIENETVVGGSVVVDDLILTRRDGITINAGNVRGPQGLKGDTGDVGPKTARIPHTWHIPGEVKVASGDTDFILPMSVPVPVGVTVAIAAINTKLNSGTSVTWNLVRGNPDTNLVTGVSTTTTHNQTTSGAGTTITNTSLIRPVVTAVSGTPKNMMITVFLDYTF